jgi:nucleoside-diphosphate-sugar epimerase
MRVLVTGASGFIGRNLVEYLAYDKQYEVTCLARDNNKASILRGRGLDCIVADITDRSMLIDAMKDVNADVLFHLAALNPLVKGKSRHYSVNIIGMKNIIDAITCTGIKTVIYTQGLGVYGNPEGLIDEQTPYNASNWFTKMRSMAEDMLIEASRSYNFTAKIAILGDVYGNGGWFKDIVVKRLRDGTFRVIGSGEYYRCFIHVYDVVRALESMITNEYKKVIVTDDQPCRFRDFIYYTADLLNVDKPSRVPTLIAKLLLGSAIVDTLTASIKTDNSRLRSFYKLAFPDYRQGVKEVIDHHHI